MWLHEQTSKEQEQSLMVQQIAKIGFFHQRKVINYGKKVQSCGSGEEYKPNDRRRLALKLFGQELERKLNVSRLLH